MSTWPELQAPDTPPAVPHQHAPSHLDTSNDSAPAKEEGGATSTWGWEQESTADPASGQVRSQDHPHGGGDEEATAATAATACGGLDHVEYRRQHGKEIDLWLSIIEYRAGQNPNNRLQDGVTFNPARAPFVSPLFGGCASENGKSGSATQGSEPFWKWSILLQRWIHEDNAAGVLYIYPRQLTH